MNGVHGAGGVHDVNPSREDVAQGQEAFADGAMIGEGAGLDAVPDEASPGQALLGFEVEDEEEVGVEAARGEAPHVEDGLDAELHPHALVGHGGGEVAVGDDGLPRREGGSDDGVDELGTAGHIEEEFALGGHVVVGGIEEDAPDLLAQGGAAGLADQDDVEAVGFGEPFLQEPRLGGLSGPVGAVEDDEDAAWGGHGGILEGSFPDGGIIAASGPERETGGGTGRWRTKLEASGPWCRIGPILRGDRVDASSQTPAKAGSIFKPLLAALEGLGEWLSDAIEGAGFAVSMFLEALYWLKAIWQKRGFVAEKIVYTGFGSLPVVLLVAFFTGLILALQSGIEAQRYNQESAVGALVAATMFREMGPVMTAIILAALVGSAYAAELGTMAVSEEIDALRVMSIPPVKFLVMPRVVALAITAPILTLVSDVVGIIGGAVIAKQQLRVDFTIYYDWVQFATNLEDIFNGLLKAFVFGLIIAVVGCSQGIRATRGAEGVGNATMRAVVVSFVLILIGDYLINWFVYPML